jgi:hypothetical protein
LNAKQPSVELQKGQLMLVCTMSEIHAPRISSFVLPSYFRCFWVTLARVALEEDAVSAPCEGVLGDFEREGDREREVREREREATRGRLCTRVLLAIKLKRMVRTHFKSRSLN